MRYWSLPVQELRSTESLAGALKRDGYVGTYVLMGGLNAARFAGLKLDSEASRLAFGHYFDLQIASAFCQTLSRLRASNVMSSDEESSFCIAAAGILDPDSPRPETLSELHKQVSDRRRAVDDEVNSATLEQRPPELSASANPGALFYGLPTIAGEAVASLNGLVLTYLLDELENLNKDQQRFVQTLIRERADPVGLVVAGRTYGIHTYETLAAGEVNRAGAEFEEVPLDDVMRDEEGEFKRFCTSVVRLRLEAAGLSNLDLPRMMPERDAGSYGEELDLQPGDSSFSPALTHLMENLNGYKSTVSLGRSGAVDSSHLCSLLKDLQRPLIEKAAALALYQDWNAGKYLDVAAEAIHDDILHDGRARLHRLLNHFRADLLAQLRREHGRPQEYSGFSTIVDLADGNARNFVNIMKSVVSWSEFMGLDISLGHEIPVEAQRRAVLDTADWFYSDAQVVGRASDRARVGLERLCEFFEKLRFSDKPVESSLSAFNVDLDALSRESRVAVEAAADWSLLVERSSRKDRNEARRTATYQVNRMLAPRWSLPIARRGVIDLSTDEVDAMFATEDRDAFEGVLSRRLARMNAPFHTLAGGSTGPDQQTLL
jgi:hypothetical protein